MDIVHGRSASRPGSGCATVPEIDEEHKPKKFEIKEKIREMLAYGMPLVNKFPRRDRKMADIMRDSMLEMERLAIRLEKKYYKKTTLEDLDIELAVLKDFVFMASDKAYSGDKFQPPLTIHQREVWSRHNDEIGRMIGGYMKWIESRKSDKGSKS